MTLMRVSDIRDYFVQELKNENFTTDRTGSKTIEMLGASFLADEPAIFGSPNHDYIDAEVDWYLSESTNINDLAKIYGKSPKSWEYTANEYGEINSNYGLLVFSEKYYSQASSAVFELLKNPDSRRAQMIYNRPSIWAEFDENGKNDFICTNAQTVYIRDRKLHMVCQMRSNDSVFGYKNDYAWAKYLLGYLTDLYNLNTDGKTIFPGDIIWQVMNLHVYEKHFGLING